MSKHEFAKRLKCMIDKECQVLEMESALVKQHARLKHSINNLESVINQQWHDNIVPLQKQVNEQVRKKETLVKLIKIEESRLQQAKEIIVELQSKHEQLQNKENSCQKYEFDQMEKIRFLKECTNTYMNVKNFPDIVQGIHLCEKENSTEWKPFRIDPTKFSQQEVNNYLWNQSQISNTFQAQWDNLILHSLNIPKNIENSANSNCLTNLPE